MRIAVIGGRPAGLYFSILMKRDFPAARITVVERNRSDDTFGFGVVFSDATLDTFQKADEPSYRAITNSFALLGRHRDPRQGRCAPHRRATASAAAPAARSLLLLQERARALGVEMEFRREASPETSRTPT
jgi:anthraniloyl-CoA monooxygenase